METPAPAKARKPNPLCAGGCKHPRTMHGTPPGRCRAIGCKCQGYVSPAED